jgi:hypothetical protein
MPAYVETGKSAQTFAVDLIGLHDGIQPNDTNLTDRTALPVVRLGDCREALGARAALAGGQAGAAALAAQLLGQPAPADQPDVARQRAAQARLAKIYSYNVADKLTALPDETVSCRYENCTLADLRALGPAPTARELRLDGRFAMGACQDRFCAEWVGRVADPAARLSRIVAARWPISPISVADLRPQLISQKDQTNDTCRQSRHSCNLQPLLRRDFSGTSGNLVGTDCHDRQPCAQCRRRFSRLDPASAKGPAEPVG